MRQVALLGEVQLAYDDAGREGAEVLCCLHGFPHTRALWQAQRQALSGTTRVLVPDLRGFGESRGPAARTIDDHADDIVRLLDQIDVAQAVFCGLSMGGYIAFALWRRHPTRVRALVLADTRAGADSADARARRATLIEVVERKGAAALAELQLPAMLGATTHATRPDVVDTMRRMMAEQPVPAIVDALHALRDREDSTATLPTITVPTMLVVGTEDTLTPPAEAEAMASGLTAAPLVRLERIERAGHVSCLERPAAFSCALAEFLGTLDPA